MDGKCYGEFRFNVCFGASKKSSRQHISINSRGRRKTEVFHYTPYNRTHNAKVKYNENIIMQKFRKDLPFSDVNCFSGKRSIAVCNIVGSDLPFPLNANTETM